MNGKIERESLIFLCVETYHFVAKNIRSTVHEFISSEILMEEIILQEGILTIEDSFCNI